MDHTIQAEQFLAYHKRKGGPIRDNFARWAESKELAPNDLQSIWDAVEYRNLPLGWEGVEPVT